LKRAEEERDRFFELSRDMLAIANIEGCFIRVNSAWTQVLGYSQQEMMSRPYLDFVHPEDRDITGKIADALSRGEPTIGFENRYRRKDGTYCWLEWSVSPFPQQGVLYAVAHDVTRRKQAQIEREKLLIEAQKARDEAERANQIKDDFLAVLSHELRTPLNPISGWAQILRGQSLDSERAQAGLATIERNARLQIQLVDDLLDMSRILRGKLVLKPQPIDLIEVVGNAIETVRLAAETKNIWIETDFQSQTCSVNGDSSRLQQVVWNLLSNAVKFTPEGGLVTVRLQRVKKSIQLQVIDTGKGIASDFLPCVFERFRQADGTIARQFGGLGLGLAIASKIIEMHGSTISVDSLGEGKGATFTVTIPALVTQPETVSDTTPLLLQDVELLSGLQLLVIDDEPDSLEIGCIMLEQFGASVTAVSSAIEAFEVLSNSFFDGIVCDIGMPSIDGYQFIEKVRAMEAENVQTLPAIALTAYAGSAEKERALAAGFQAHVAKPVDAIELAHQVLRLCKTDES
jgi:PAS domain S-box-containing protein